MEIRQIMGMLGIAQQSGERKSTIMSELQIERDHDQQVNKLGS